MRPASSRHVLYVMRNERLGQQMALEWLCGRMEDVMPMECLRYKEEKSCRSKKSKNGDINAKPWERFVRVAKSSAGSMGGAPSSAKQAGIGVKNRLNTTGGLILVKSNAASQVPTRKEKPIKLSQPILRRIKVPRMCLLRASASRHADERHRHLSR
ncbi:hypothetical protein K469DRAFT_82752 [Zopfia rhizophila CBS 207.26]|uniref:Uncharacterized protein n=1 Tax=Zopfia rhizophila CBS 207.26 TaxID=1314779 RepID=A0A6A6ED80_9PEZI|nr:hypothetical protein K469DRAFT_82752 [Zopfia rhizophila CBS 207.26]